ncbi:MAG: hypothetical protein ABR535_03150, partial [Pyrinomonadaceae bacterium]
MKKRSRNMTIVAVLSVLFCTAVAATEVRAQRYSGRATAIRTVISVPVTGPITTAINDTGELPADGGSITLASASASIAGAALTAGASSSTTSGGSPAGTSHSQTSVAN